MCMTLARLVVLVRKLRDGARPEMVEDRPMEARPDVVRGPEMVDDRPGTGMALDMPGTGMALGMGMLLVSSERL